MFDSGKTKTLRKSLEVMPRTYDKFGPLVGALPQGTEVFIAHIDGVPIEDMCSAAERLVDEGIVPVPHIAARSLRDETELDMWLEGYKACGVRQFLLLGGGAPVKRGSLSSALELLSMSFFHPDNVDKVFLAGHPEGNKDIESVLSDETLWDILREKQDLAISKGIDVEIVTQFVFESGPIFEWLDQFLNNGITAPVRVGLAGPTKLSGLLKHAAACGVGPSMRVLKKRALNVAQLARPFTPDELLKDFSRAHPQMAGVHIFPLGGIAASVPYVGAPGAGRG